MRQTRKQRLLKKRARFRLAALASYGLILVGTGAVWIMFALASGNCSDSTPCAQAGSPVATTDWSLRFSDEFNGSALDTSKWNTGRFSPTTAGEEPYNGNKEGAYFSTNNVGVSGGAANIKIQPSRKVINGNTYPYSSGEINTSNNLELRPGDYVEARIKVPKCSGCWPAFWTIGGTPPVEFDIFEFFNTAVRGRPSFNFHAANHSETGVASYGENGYDYRNSYHTYGMYWTGTSVMPYLDGKPYPLGLGPTTDIPQYLILNLSSYANFAPGTAQMQVDWVRVWEPPQATVSLASVNTPDRTVVQPITAPQTSPTPVPTDASIKPKAAPVPAVPVVGGRFQIDVPAGTVKQKVSVDGTAVTTGKQLDTRWLQNGQHIVTIQASGAKGAITTTTIHILVNNRLNLFEAARNDLFAPFHGNIAMTNFAGSVLSLIALTGMALVWWVLVPRKRTRAVGLAI